ncbi:MAG: hypothetical protein ACYDDF_13065 [Thermoplasmatota archaeon]
MEGRTEPFRRLGRSSGWLLVIFLIASTLAGQTAAAGVVPGTAIPGTALNTVSWHPYPDANSPAQGGDPFGFPAANSSADWMASYYGAYYFPTARFDGVIAEANQADFDARSFLASYQSDYETRAGIDTPIVLIVNGTVAGRSGSTTIIAQTTTNLTQQHLVLRAVVVEDDVAYKGTNGVTIHRFVARKQLPDRAVNWVANGSEWGFGIRYEFSLGNGTDGSVWHASNLGVVAWVQNVGVTGPFAPREVLQSTTYMFRNAAPTVQVRRGVLLELYTATWCSACVFGDGAQDVLLQEFGVPSSIATASTWRYLSLPSTMEAALGLLVAVPLTWALWRRLP